MNSWVLLRPMVFTYTLVVLSFAILYVFYTKTIGNDFQCERDDLVDTITHALFTSVLVTNGSLPSEPRSIFGRAIVTLQMMTGNVLVLLFFSQAFMAMLGSSAGS